MSNIEQTTLLCGIGVIVMFIEFLALAPDPYVEWFYGKPQSKPFKVEKFIEVRYQNGVPVDTILVVKKEIREDE